MFSLIEPARGLTRLRLACYPDSRPASGQAPPGRERGLEEQGSVLCTLELVR